MPAASQSAQQGLETIEYGLYPSTTGDYLRDVVPVSVHSHNDYWRDIPLITALSYGCSSIEADVWLVNGTLYIGHDVASLRPNRTFSSLYINPLVTILDQKNPSNSFTAYAKSNFSYTESNGVFDTSAALSLNLLVDVKTNGAETWPYVVAALEPLRQRGYLSYVNASDTNVNSRQVTVIGTGNTPLNYLLARPNRDYFFDAPLAALNSTFKPTLSPLASMSFRANIGWTGVQAITSAQETKMKQYIDQARSMGLKSRMWESPLRPVFARNAVWLKQIQLGLDYLNADDLEAASGI
ncbi:hypothetical protein BCR37DRAFT_346768 [Protomyces lactucae-debilis]|uniref:Altered inheritance of mitochondria protein 6 n=1 Tax=Protomyces lactucae-debilis TaxID=2754530 RepID=A0A1Y2FGH0_PROLT|nr:uncharacterized protein BCR37DRAFT_346768 [Protomyces lactucae-debilis]ORY83013.1 hypothetical protein BCR37DRAFT_346768 [Protomyces lactucae-debilis]